MHSFPILRLLMRLVGFWWTVLLTAMFERSRCSYGGTGH